jgi:hypothetical protein
MASGMSVGRAQEPQQPTRLYKPVADDVYLQEVGSSISTAQPVTAVAVLNSRAYAVIGGQVSAVSGDSLQPLAGAPSGVRRLESLGDALWAATDSGAYRYSGGAWSHIDSRPFVDFCLHLGRVYGATHDALFRLEGDKFVDIKPAGGYLSNDTTVMKEDFTEVLADPVQIGSIDRIGSYSGTLYLLRPGGLALLDGKMFTPDPMDWGKLPSSATRDMLVQGSRLFVATDHGVGMLRGMSMTALRSQDGLPEEDATCLASGFDDDLWIGTTHGAIRKAGDLYRTFNAQKGLPADSVRDIAVSDHAVYVATDGGLGIIRYEPYTLQKKAAYYEREMNEWGFKRLGFINPIYRAGDEWRRGITDNDGGNTASYLAAMSLKYAATGDESARKEAVEAFNAIAWCGDITGKSGFIARAIWSVKGDKGQRENRGSGGLPAKWYPTKDGLWIWKGDTSSDEVDSHFYAVSLFHDLAAKGREKERARDHLARIAAHIMDHGWVLEDMDGQPTRWGRWDPKYLMSPYGAESLGLNGMEAQCFMITAYALTGDPRFQRGMEQLLKWRYQMYTVRQKLTFPPDSVVPWDDNLAFCAYFPLLRYTRDPDLRSIYLRSITRTWEVVRPQHNPWFNYVYGALTGNDCEAPESAQFLRDASLDLMEGKDRVSPPSEWLEAYWFGRYFGMIARPVSTDARATAISLRPFIRHGAPPYDGPPRPPAP